MKKRISFVLFILLFACITTKQNYYTFQWTLEIEYNSGKMEIIQYERNSYNGDNVHLLHKNNCLYSIRGNDTSQLICDIVDYHIIKYEKKVLRPISHWGSNFGPKVSSQ